MKREIFLAVVVAFGAGQGCGDSSGASEEGTGTTEDSSTNGCPNGSGGCPCYGNSTCDPGLMCVNDYCVDPSCPEGSVGCPCYGNGTCNEGLVCQAGQCVDASTTSGADTTSSSTSTTDGTTETGTGTTDTTGTGTGGNPLDGWTKRRPILLDNGLNDTLSDFQARLNLTFDTDMKNDFSDLRFTDASETLLPFWVERSLPTVDADVWVRVPTIPAMDVTTIYVYYGNPAASSAGDGDATFPFFDDFSGAMLDPGKWVATDTVVLQSGVLNVETGAVFSVGTPFDAPGYTLWTRMQWPGPTGGQAGVALNSEVGKTATSFAMETYRVPDLFVTAFDGNMGIGSQQAGGQGLGSWIDMRMGIDVGTLHFQWTDPGKASFPYTWSDPLHVYLGSTGGGNAGSGDGWDVQFDHVLVRRFASEDPSTAVGAEEDVP